MNKPIVKPVVDPPPNKPRKPIHENLPDVSGGALVLMVMPIKCGKSTIVSNLLLREDFYGQDYFDNVTIISNTINQDKTSRFLKKAFEVYDTYNDGIIEGIVNQQKEFDAEDRPSVALILDDVLGSIRRESYVNHLASRFRHYGIELLLFSSQLFKKVNNVIRSNATDLIVGCPFQSQTQLDAIEEEYGEMYQGNFKEIYKLATGRKRFDFMYTKLGENPIRTYRNFEDLIAIGGNIVEGQQNEKNEKEDVNKKDDTIIKDGSVESNRPE